FSFTSTAITYTYTLSLHDALPIFKAYFITNKRTVDIVFTYLYPLQFFLKRCLLLLFQYKGYYSNSLIADILIRFFSLNLLPFHILISPAKKNKHKDDKANSIIYLT